LRVLVIGGSGATGKPLVNYLLESPQVGSVTCLGRKVYDCFTPSQKLTQIVVNFESMDDLLKNDNFNVKHDVAICTLGTTRADAGSDAAFKLVDYTYVSNFATFCKQHSEVSHFHLLTSVGANKNSWVLYARTKGEIEEYVTNLGFKYTSIYRPGLLDRGDQARTLEKLGSIFMKSLPVESLGKKIAHHSVEKWSEGDVSGVEILESSAIFKLPPL